MQPSNSVTRKHLAPFGKVTSKVQYEKLKEEALRTLSRQECFDKGFLTVKDMDDEELRYGRCRDNSGHIPTKKGHTELIPRDRYDDMVAEHELRYKQKLRQNLDDMLDTMVDIAKDETVEPRDRFEAAKYLFERTAGKTPDTVNVNVTNAPWEELLNQVTGIATVTRAEHRRVDGAGIIDAEVVPDGCDGKCATDECVCPQEQEEQDAEEDLDEDSGLLADIQVDGEDASAGMETVHEDRHEDSGPREHTATAEPNDAHDKIVQHGQYVANNDKPVYITEGDIDSRPDPYQGHRKAQAKSYAEQTRDAAALVERRKQAKAKVNLAKKQRKIARAMGTDAIKTEITGVDIGEDGQVTFGTE